jgi:hypothetical protein
MRENLEKKLCKRFLIIRQLIYNFKALSMNIAPAVELIRGLKEQKFLPRFNVF